MSRVACVAVVTLLLSGCGHRDVALTTLPEFAARLPGQTAILMFSREQDLPQGLLAGMSESLPAQSTYGGFNRLGPRVIYLDLPEAQTGWQSLADSANFRQALAIAPADAEIVIYLDLQLIFANVWHDLRERIPAQFRYFTDAFYLDEFQFLIAGVNEQTDDGYRISGSIQTGGSGVGVAGLFPAAAKGLSLLAGASSDDTLQLEMQIDPSKARGIIHDLYSRNSRDLIASMMNQVISVGLKVAEQALAHLSGRVSMRIDSSRDWGLAAEVNDPDALMDLLDRHLREESGDAWLLPGDFRLYMRENLLLLGPLAEQGPAVRSGQRATALFGRVSVADQSYEFKLMPGVERMDFELKRGK